MKMSQNKWIVASGVVWLLGGGMLLYKGLSLLLRTTGVGGDAPNYLFLEGVAPALGGLQSAALVVIVLSLLVGNLKARFIFSKTVRRLTDRIRSFPNPLSLSQALPFAYFLLIGVMVGFGVLMNVFNVPSDLRGSIDVAIGAGLIKGATFYFRAAATKAC
jgi:hypothetical protein